MSLIRRPDKRADKHSFGASSLTLEGCTYLREEPLAPSTGEIITSTPLLVCLLKGELNLSYGELSWRIGAGGMSLLPQGMLYRYEKGGASWS